MAFGRIGDPIRYGFAVGRVRVLETRLLGRPTWERLLDAPAFADQSRVLSETHFGRCLEGTVTADDVERGVDASLEDLYEEFLERANLPEPVVAFFRAPYDFANLKALVRARALGVSLGAPLSPLGSVALEDFERPDALTGELREAASALLADRADEAGDGAAADVDAVVDDAMFDALARHASEARIPFLAGLAARMADVANVKVLMRSCLARRTPREAASMLVPGGSFDAAALSGEVRRPPAELAAMLLEADAVRGAAVEDLTDHRRLDVVADGSLAESMRVARRVALGPEPVIAYVLARQSEAVWLRALLIGTLSGVERDVLRARVAGAMA